MGIARGTAVKPFSKACLIQGSRMGWDRRDGASGDPELSRARDPNSPGERGWDGTACMGCRASAWEASSCLIFYIRFCEGFLIWYHQARLLSASQATRKLEK